MVTMVVPKVSQQIEALLHSLERHRLGVVVEFVAIRACQIAAPHGDNVGQDRMVRRDQTFEDHAQLTKLAGVPSAIFLAMYRATT